MTQLEATLDIVKQSENQKPNKLTSMKMTF